FDLPPLSLPVAGGPVGEAEAVQLFVERVQALDPTFALTAANETAVAAVACRLEGIPLALELAASHIEILGLAGLLAGLEACLDLPARVRRDGSGRPTTLRATIAWSWDLLDPTERAVL